MRYWQNVGLVRIAEVRIRITVAPALAQPILHTTTTSCCLVTLFTTSLTIEHIHSFSYYSTPNVFVYVSVNAIANVSESVSKPDLRVHVCSVSVSRPLGRAQNILIINSGGWWLWHDQENGTKIHIFL